MRFMRVQTPDLEWYKNNVPCQVACPAKTDIPRYISLIAQHRYRESYEVNCGSNLFPDILGRVCSHPCETVCRRKKIDGKPIAIRDLKRVAADYRDSIAPAFSPVQMMEDDGRNGVAPNIRVPISPEQERLLFAARSSGDTIKPDEDKNFIKSNDPQMLRAIDALKGVMIYAQQNAPKGEVIKK